MTLDIPHLLADLARHRPVFHCKKDFQNALGSHLLETHPEYQVCLKYPFEHPTKKIIDILVRNGDQEMAIELKYPSQQFEGRANEKQFTLKNHGAHDQQSYDVLKGVERLEKFVAGRPGAAATVLLLTNDPRYWEGWTKPDVIGARFTLCEGRTATGRLDWGRHAGEGSKKKHQKGPIVLKGEYTMNWRDYSRLPASHGDYGEFRFLYIPISAG